ncbi:MAG TPA: hypothetical protein DCZ92_10670 [Elusimicrobia bacterium]|nr:MAG: hypothetical protein A2016_04360 [Elusimicrobia bacterium GWF2_62_30]HBA61257.1 hypothetical protein [Elusimicrobiota bacterium]
MTIDYESFMRASTLSHSVQGASLLLLGLAEIYTRDNPGHKAGLAGAIGLMLGGAASFIILLVLPGSGSFNGLLEALAARKGFYIFVSFSCLFTAMGLSRLMQQLTGGKGRAWQAVFLLLLAATGVVYLLMGGRVNEEVARQVMKQHLTIGVMLLLAVLVKAVNLFSGSRLLNRAWAILLIAVSVQLLAYREKPGAFAVHTVTIQTGPVLPAAAGIALPVDLKNAAPPLKKRPGN